MTYRAPVDDIVFTLLNTAGLKKALDDGLYPDVDAETVAAVLGEAGRFAGDIIAPLNAVGDKIGAKFADGKVTTPPGFKDAYTNWAAAGWNGIAATPDFGGQGLPIAVNAACIEMWNSASMAFSLNPLLTGGAIEALTAHASEELKERYLAKDDLRRMDRHDAPDRAAGRLRRRRTAHQGGAQSRRQLPHHRAEDLHHLGRARPDRQHHPHACWRACTDAPPGNARHLAVHRAEIPARRGRHARRAQRHPLPLDRA